MDYNIPYKSNHKQFTIDNVKYAKKYLMDNFGIKLPIPKSKLVFMSKTEYNSPVLYKKGKLIIDLSDVEQIRKNQWLEINEFSETMKNALNVISDKKLETKDEFNELNNRLLGNYPKNYFFANLLKELVVMAIEEEIIPGKNINFFTNDEITSIMKEFNLNPNEKSSFNLFSKSVNAEAMAYLIANSVNSKPKDPIFIPSYYPKIAIDKIRSACLKMREKGDNQFTHIQQILMGNAKID